MTIIDTHPHIIAGDDNAYPRSPLFGLQSDWSRERPVAIEGLVAEMDKAGVTKAAIVQASTCYGFDNSYVTDSITGFPGRFTAVGSVDLVAPDAVATIRAWSSRGVSGLRIFTGGSTKAFDPSSLDDPRSFPAWEFCGEAGISICLQTDPVGHERVGGLAKRFPKVKILLDHLGRADVTGGPPYDCAASLFELAPLENVYFKLTPRVFADSGKGAATPQTLFPHLVQVFGANRLAWGSNFPATEGPLSAILARARECVASLAAEDQGWIFGRTAQSVYPALAGEPAGAAAPGGVAG
jgi:predicted TIM-barrel fold metal-dependent hydrolase